MNGAKGGYQAWKRVFDLVAVVAALPVLLPLGAAVALAVAATAGRPVLFRQRRGGRGGRVFTLYKFRTMREGGKGDEDRLTRIGRFLRRASLDELPQFLNVLKGDMSVIGPRPLLEEYLPLYTAAQARRHDVRPGLTGWAQVNGRNALSWEEKFALDVWYVENLSPWLDLRIFARTLLCVLSRSSVTAPGGGPVEKFRGGGAAEGRP